MAGYQGLELSPLVSKLLPYDNVSLREGAHLTGKATSRELLVVVRDSLREEKVPLIQEMVYGLRLAAEFARDPSDFQEVEMVAREYNGRVRRGEHLTQVPLFKAVRVPYTNAQGQILGYGYYLESRGVMKIGREDNLGGNYYGGRKSVIYE